MGGEEDKKKKIPLEEIASEQNKKPPGCNFFLLRVPIEHQIGNDDKRPIAYSSYREVYYRCVTLTNAQHVKSYCSTCEEKMGKSIMFCEQIGLSDLVEKAHHT